MPKFLKVENPDWTHGFLEDHKKELDEYCELLRRDPGACTPGAARRPTMGSPCARD